MTDVFDATIMCKKCNVEMKPTIVNREGFELRAVECPECKDKIIHPADLNGVEHYRGLKNKTFNVKLRMVGNSHAISIPKEIIDFMEENHRQMKRQMDEMVRLCFEDFDRLSLQFFDDEDENDAENIDDKENRFIRLKKQRRVEDTHEN